MKQTLIAYSFSHFVVDFLCGFMVFSIPNFHPGEIGNMLMYIVLYGSIAFALQAPLGRMCDKRPHPKGFALVGISLNVLALGLLFFSPFVAVIITGLGNALFHVGGGVITLGLGKKGASLPGIFVSTGAMGVFLGTFLPLHTNVHPRHLAVVGITTLIFLTITKLPPISYEKAEALTTLKSLMKRRLFLICFFILLSVFIRSVIGFLVPFPRKSGFLLGLIFTCCVICGKAFGGILADKFGLERVGIGSLAISAVLLGFCSANPVLGMIGIFLFNMTMPITLVILANTLKGRKGFAFGLTTLALIIGAMPYYAGFSLDKRGIFVSIVISIVALVFGLRCYRTFLLSKS